MNQESFSFMPGPACWIEMPRDMQAGFALTSRRRPLPCMRFPDGVA